MTREKLLNRFSPRDLIEKESFELFVVVGDTTDRSPHLVVRTFQHVALGLEMLTCCHCLLKEKGLLPDLSPQVEDIVCSLDQELHGAAATVATILRQKGQTC
ncbi:hypothetical protein NE237_008384 [Protea cynaroides]|uniref:Uncharacterized protein n=1 Tax=Protea cynaroides TaxID=273540 RepID=A0A9Q0KWM7_9MAGN|nr:hypothetical protein NE237_008384 [Protea cynaroides]